MNSNFDSEIEAASSFVVDECDQTPVPAAEVVSTDQLGPQPFSVTNTVLVDGRNLAGTEKIDTGFRFCKCSFARANSVESRTACDAFSDCERNDLLVFDADTHWKRMRLDNGGNDASNFTGIEYDGPGQRDGGADTHGKARYPRYKVAAALTWDIVEDAVDWDVEGAGEVADFAMPGVLWAHAWGLADEDEDEDDEIQPFDEEIRELSSSYVTGVFGLKGGSDQPDTDPSIPFGPAAFPFSDICQQCPWSFPAPFLMVPPCFGNNPCSDPAEARFEDLVTDAGSFFSGGAPSGLGTTSGKWVAVSEPDIALGESGLRFTAVATNGTSINSVLSLGAAGLSRTVPSNSGTPPASRSLFGVTASAQKNRVWVMGGITSTGTLKSDLFQFDVATQTWSQVTISGTTKPARVLAAAYDPHEDRLLVLDQATAGGSVRLLRLDPNGVASSELVTTWSRTASTTTFGISAENADRGYVVACGGGSTHAVLRLKKTTSGTTIWANANGSGSLESGAIQAGALGVSLLVKVSGLARARGYETAAMSAGGSSGICF